MIIEEVFDLIPNIWTPSDYSNVPFTTIPITDVYSPEFIDIMEMFDGNYFSCITGLFRVQNPYLWAKYLLKKREYEKRGPVEINPCYHDTATSNIDSICSFNLDWRMGNRAMYGPGVYFSTNPSTAFKHSSRHNGANRAMFLVDVLMQNIQPGDETTVFPDFGYDTVVAHGGVTYVKYFDCEYYPRYFVTYDVRNGTPMKRF